MVPQILPVGRDREMVGDVVVHPSFYFSVVLVGERLVWVLVLGVVEGYRCFCVVERFLAKAAVSLNLLSRGR